MYPCKSVIKILTKSSCSGVIGMYNDFYKNFLKSLFKKCLIKSFLELFSRVEQLV